MKYPDITLGRVEAVWNRLGGEEGVDRLLRGELVVSDPARCWREQDGVISFSVTSDGTTGPQWIERLEKAGFRIGNYAKSVLLSPDFRPTSGVTTEIAVLRGMFWPDEDRITNKIRAEAECRHLISPNAEVACLIREMFSDKEIKAMGLWWIVVMHEPITDSDGGPDLLGVDRDDGGRWLGVYCGGPGSRWGREHGFAFAVSQVAS